MTGEPTLFPRTYRAPRSRALAKVVKGVVLFGLAAFGRAHLDAMAPSWAWMFAGVLLVLIVFMIWDQARCRITLYPGRIERRTWFGSRNWAREDVGYVSPRRGRGFALVHRYNRGYRLDIPAGIARDEGWETWLRTIPEHDPEPTLREWLFRWLPGQGSKRSHSP